MWMHVNYFSNSQKCNERVTLPTTNSDPSKNGLLIHPKTIRSKRRKKKTCLTLLKGMISRLPVKVQPFFPEFCLATIDHPTDCL
ncbi:hypothetical protein Pan110_23930 [Gimesia panareensis]|nr:hypothetical protein Pan110_23930 [Gimesia panareensis]